MSIALQAFKRLHTRSELHDDPKQCRHYFRDAADPASEEVALNSHEVFEELNPGRLNHLNAMHGVATTLVEEFIQSRAKVLGVELKAEDIKFEEWTAHTWGRPSKNDIVFPQLARGC